jgi:hypothetical protein
MDKQPRKRHRPSSRPDVASGSAFLSPERFEPKARGRLGAPALRTFAAITEGWGLSEAQRLSVLGFPGRATYHYWLAKSEMPMISDTVAISSIHGGEDVK